ncbi:MAG: capsule biosynthesis protein [[Pasteurella] mairii]|uniref:Protein PhyB n=1 Tax=[Pasteurella] mairii TaxID=757 RepID=A0A379B2L8_9PAST|nr:capsule biosynthesis protein [[Pasteurella] mairii]SUB32549.1 protein PhyB [[Pasteurella] mairii]
MIKHNLDELVLSSKNILLLQGPIGSFFLEFSHWLQTQNKRVFKLNFNAGDEYFYPKNEKDTFSYSGTCATFLSFLKEFCIQHEIDTIACFGDNRKYHIIANKLASQLGITFWAFEEGYFRPNYVTLEKSGVNAFSPIPKKANYFWGLQEQIPSIYAPQNVAGGFWRVAKIATCYYVLSNLRKADYTNYEHHRILNVSYYIKLWGISGIKRIFYYLQDRNFAKKVERGTFGDFFIVPLQVYDDSQVIVHSDYLSVEHFLREVIESFIAHAPQHLTLIVKHHPMDRGFVDYRKVIQEYIDKAPQLKKRIYYVHDVPMPVFLRHGKGMVTLNSTSGISALIHNMPVKTLGRANYDFEGLTDQGSLDNFWTNPTKPNEQLFNLYRAFHLNKTQINGNFYRKTILRFPYNLE